MMEKERQNGWARYKTASVRKLVWLCFAVLAAVAGVALGEEKPDAVIAKVWPDKLVYGFDSPGTITVSLKHPGEELRTARLKMVLLSQLDRERVLYDGPARGDGKETAVSFRTGRKSGGAEYGYEVRATLIAGGRTSSVACEYFMVTDNPLKIGHLTIPTAATDHRHDWWGPSVAKGVKRTREMYFAMSEAPFWAPCDFSELTTKREIWTSGQAGRFMSLKGMKAMVDGVHAFGGWIVYYADKWACGPAGFETARRHPEWFHWGQDWYGCKYDIEMLDWTAMETCKDGKWKEQRDGGIWAICPLIANPEVAKFGIRQIVESVKQFGWDGIRFDNQGWFVDDVKDILGNPAVKPGTDIPKLEVELIRRIRRAGRKVEPHFVYGDNVDWFNEIGKASPKWLAEAEDGGLVMSEGMNGVTQLGSALNDWAYLREHLRTAITTVRMAGGYPYGIVGLAQDRVWAEDRQPPRAEVCILYAVLMASGMHLCYTVAPDYYHYMRLYARYCGLLYDDAMQVIANPAERVEVAGSRSIWWQEYVRRRDLPGGKVQFIVHLINASTGNRFNEKNEPPPIQQNVRVALRQPKGVSIRQAFHITAEGSDGPRSYELAIDTAGDRASVTVPELQCWSIVVFEGRR